MVELPASFNPTPATTSADPLFVDSGVSACFSIAFDECK
jgi:hypothetical protein